MCALLFGNSEQMQEVGVKSSELNVNGFKLIKLNRANFECSVKQPNVSL